MVSVNARPGMFGSGKNATCTLDASLCQEAHVTYFCFLVRRLLDLCVVGSFFRYVGDAGNTSLVDAGTPLGATAVVTPGSAGYLLWECCILASL